MKQLTYDELTAALFRSPMKQRCRKKDGKPMVNRDGTPVMIAVGSPCIPTDTLDRLTETLDREDIAGIALYINMMMDSSSMGDTTLLKYGPTCSYQTPEQLPPWLNDLPSQRRQLQGYYPNPRFKHVRSQ